LMKQTVIEVAKKNLSEEECNRLQDCRSPSSILKTAAEG
jgi:hypothetical protein